MNALPLGHVIAVGLAVGVVVIVGVDDPVAVEVALLVVVTVGVAVFVGDPVAIAVAVLVAVRVALAVAVGLLVAVALANARRASRIRVAMLPRSIMLSLRHRTEKRANLLMPNHRLVSISKPSRRRIP